MLTFLDVDVDGSADVVSSGERNNAGVFLGDGKGHFKKVDDPETAKLFAITTGGCYTTPQAVLDLDGDGKPDIITYQPRVGGGSAVLRWLGGGKFQKVLTTRASSGQTYADLDNDGLVDIVSSGSPRSKGLHVWLNTTPQPGNWLKVQVSGPKQNPFAVTAEIEAFPAGTGTTDSKSIAHGVVKSAGLPVHLGLGATEKVNLCIRLGGKVVRELKGVTTRQLLKVNLADEAK